jgi:hypothetical protein
MWKSLPPEGAALVEVRVEGSGKDRDVIIVPKAGERLRFPSAGDVAIETVGRVLVRTTAIDDTSVRITFSGDLVLERAEVGFDGTAEEWQSLWRRARTRSRPWWRQSEQEIELDWALNARLTIVGSDKAGRPRSIPPTPAAPT